MVFFKGGSRGQISPCLRMISQRNKRKVGSVVDVARRLFYCQTRKVLMQISQSRVSENFEGS